MITVPAMVPDWSGMSDFISRQDAIDAIVRLTNFDNVDVIRYECRRNYEKDNGWLGGLKDALNAVEDLPSAEPERTAKVKEGWGLAMCCACEKRVFPYDKYCSHCGARLEWE